MQPVQQHAPFSPRQLLSPASRTARSRPALRRCNSDFSPQAQQSPHSEKVRRRNSSSIIGSPRGSSRLVSTKPSALKPSAAVDHATGADLASDLASAAEALAAVAELNAAAIARVQVLSNKTNAVPELRTTTPTTIRGGFEDFQCSRADQRSCADSVSPDLRMTATDVKPSRRQVSTGIGAQWEQKMAGLLVSNLLPTPAPSTPPYSPSSTSSCSSFRDAHAVAVEELTSMPPSTFGCLMTTESSACFRDVWMSDSKILSATDELSNALSASQKLQNEASRELTGIIGCGTLATGVTSQAIASPLPCLRGGRLSMRASLLWALLVTVLIAWIPIILPPRDTAGSTDHGLQRRNKRLQRIQREQQRRREAARQFDADRRAALRFSDPSGPWLVVS